MSLTKAEFIELLEDDIERVRNAWNSAVPSIASVLSDTQADELNSVRDGYFQWAATIKRENYSRWQSIKTFSDMANELSNALLDTEDITGIDTASIVSLINASGRRAIQLSTQMQSAAGRTSSGGSNTGLAVILLVAGVGLILAASSGTPSRRLARA